MAVQPTTTPAPAPNPAATPAPVPTTSPAPQTTPAPRGEADAPTTAESERERIAAILDSPEAQGRESLARHLALATDLSSTSARAILGAAPITTPASAAPVNPLAREMASIRNPVVGVGGAAQEEEDSPAAEAARILTFVPKDRKVAS